MVVEGILVHHHVRCGKGGGILVMWFLCSRILPLATMVVILLVYSLWSMHTNLFSELYVYPLCMRPHSLVPSSTRCTSALP